MENYTVLIHASLFLTVCVFWIYAAVCETMGHGLTLKHLKSKQMCRGHSNISLMAMVNGMKQKFPRFRREM